jgi:hypothetical protein
MNDLPPPNYDESAVPAYTLPALLTFNDGRAVATAHDWAQRRAELIQLMAAHLYGRLPGHAPALRVEAVESDDAALEGTARRRQFRVHLAAGPARASFDLLLYLPAARSPDLAPVPVWLGLNFFGNHTVHPDPAIHLPATWVPAEGELGAPGHRARECGRGAWSRRWPLAEILARGHGLATVYCGDFAPDFAGGDSFDRGVHPLLRALGAAAVPEERPGAIAAWSWGLSRALDALTTLPEVDAARVAVIGHSRLGKAALWAGATDERFALVVSNQSGCGGAALFRRRFGETLAAIDTRFPHWFSPRLRAYHERESALPFDQHQLLALIAPRPLHVGSASEDRWADPRGEFLALAAAAPLYSLFGYEALPPGAVWPASGGVVRGDRAAYHLRAGRHDLLAEDWRHYLDTAQRAWAGR